MPDSDPPPDYEGLYAAAAPDPKPTPPGMWEPPLPEEIAAYLPGYDITAILGRGGMGAVYRGVQTSLDRPIALKLLPPELGADPEFEARFVREAKSMARLNHPNIVQIYDYGRTAAGHHYIVMEYVDGTDLHRLIHDGGLTVEGALNAVSQICDALAYAHEEGFVHRDIKPANIFINSKGMLKVGDFGLAKLVEGEDRPAASALMGLTMSGVAMGTPHYIAPEQLAFEGSVDQRADIYSLGVMFYEMLTREIPRGNVKPPSQKVAELDKRIDGVVFKAMESDPAERYQSAVELRSEVDVIRTTPLPKEPAPEVKGAPRPGKKKAGSRVVAKPQEAGTSGPDPKRRSPALLAAAVGLPLILAVGGFALFSGKKTGPSETDATPAVAPSPSESAGRSESSEEPPRPLASPSVPRAAEEHAAAPAAADVAPRVENAVTLEAFLASEPVFRPDPGFPNSKRNIRLTPDRIHFLNDDGTVDLAHPLRALPNGSVEYVYMSTGRTVTVTFREAFRRLQRSDSNQPTYTFHSLGKPEALPIVAQIRLREPVSAPGRLEAIGSALPPDFLSNADPFDDFIQVSAGADAGGNQVIWAALRENGEVVLSGHTANDGVAPPSGVALIRNSRGVGFFFIHRDGRLTVTGASPEPPSDLLPVVDAVGGAGHALALHPDGSVTLWGSNYPDWSVPEAALRDVVSISASRYGALTVTADGALHLWGRDLPYRRVAAPAGDPFVKVVGVWTNPAESRVLARSGKVYRSDGKPAEIPDLADDLAYGGPILVRARDGGWRAMTVSAQLADRIPDFSEGHHFAAYMNEKTDAAVRIVPAGGEGGAGALELSAAGAASPPRMGRLRGLWWDRDVQDAVPIAIPEEWNARSVVALGSNNYGAVHWWAIDESGELLRYDGLQRQTGRPVDSVRVKAYDWARLSAWVGLDGRIGTVDTLRPVPEGDDFVDVKVGSTFALALRENGTAVYWTEQGATGSSFQPPAELLSDVVAIAAAGPQAAVLKRSGEAVRWNAESGVQPGWHPKDKRITALSGNHTSVHWLSDDGIIGASNTPEFPGKVVAYRHGHGLGAAKLGDETWHVWGRPGAVGQWLHQFAERIASVDLSKAIELSLTGDGPKSMGVAIWIEAADTAAPADLTATTPAPPPSQAPRMGRLRAFGSLRVNAETVPVPEPDDATDYIACVPSGDAWKALRANGDLVVASPLEGQLPPSPLRNVADHGIIGRQAALLKDGSVSLWGVQLRGRIEPLEKVRLFDAIHRYAVAVFEDGSTHIWNTLESESPDTYQPTREEIGDVAKVVAGNSGVCFLRRDGTVVFCKQNGIRKLLPDDLRYIDVVGVTNGFLGLTREGQVVSSGDTDRLLVPDGLPPANAVRSGLRMAAIRTEEGNWMAWAMEGFEEIAKPVIDKIATLRNVIDLGISAGDLHANLLWIEAPDTPAPADLTAPAPADDPVLKIEAAFYDRFGPEVLEPHREAVGRLDEQFLGALNRERASAVSAGDLEGVLAWKTALDRLEAGDGVPSTEELVAESPPAKRPPRLLQFYDTYRSELAKLVAVRDAKFAPLLKARNEALQALEIESTRSSDLDTAVRAKAARENPPSPEGERPAAASPVPGAAPSGAMLPPVSPALAAQLARYTIDYSRAGTLRIAGTVRQGGPPVSVPQPTAEQAAGVSFVAARYQSGSGWTAVKQDGSIIASGTEDGKAPPAAAKPRWLHAGEQMIAIDHDGKAHLWGRKNWRPARELHHVVMAESGTDNAIALHRDGSVSVWGPMYEGFQPDPAWLADVVDVAAGMSRAWVLKSDGTVLGWDREGPLKGAEGDFSQMKDLVAISGSHRRVIGLDRLGRYVNTEGPVPSPLGRMERAIAGYMLDLGLSRDGRLFLDRLDQNERRFPEAVAPALAARNLIAADGAGDGTEPNFHGFLAWIEGDELPQPPPGRLVVLGYHQDNVNGTERNYPDPGIPAGEGILAVAAQGRHGGAWLAWGTSGNPFQQRRAAWGASRPVDVVKVASDFQTATLQRDGSLRFYQERDTKGQPPTDLQGYLDLDINGYNAAALKRDGSVVLWSEDRAAEQTFHPDSNWLGDVLQARAGHPLGRRSWHFLRRDGSVGRSDASKALTAAGESAFPVPVQAIAPAREDSACLALDLEGRILHAGVFQNPLLVSQIPNERGPFVDLRCGGHYAAAQRSDGVWIAWGSEREKDEALFRQLEAAGPLRELQIAGQNADLDRNTEVGNLVIIGITMDRP